jgi:hypothetical protein
MANRGPERRRRSKLVGVRLTPEEHARLSFHAADHGTTLPGFLRELLLDYENETGQGDIVVVNADPAKGPLEIRRVVVGG